MAATLNWSALLKNVSYHDNFSCCKKIFYCNDFGCCNMLNMTAMIVVREILVMAATLIVVANLFATTLIVMACVNNFSLQKDLTQ